MKGTAAKNTGKRTAAAAKRAPAAVLAGDALSSYLQALTAAAAAPVTLTEARTRAKKDGHTVAAAELEGSFEQLASSGLVFRHPSAARGTRPVHAYWHISASELVRRRLQATLETSTQITLAKLLGCAPRQYRDLVQAALAALLRERKLFEKPGSKAKIFTTTPLPATALLSAAQRKALQSVLDKINPARNRALMLAELLQFLDGAAPAVPSTPAAPTLVLLEELYRQDLPKRGGLSSMPIPFTWRRYAAQSTRQGAVADRAAFEQLLLESAAAGLVELIAHEWPATLDSDDLAAAIRQPGGRVLYYWRPLEP